MSTELVARSVSAMDNGAAPPQRSGFEMHPRSMEEAMKFCEIMAKSDLVPKDYKDKPGNIMVAIQMGAELGLTPLRSLRCIAVINGRASMWGDDMLAMVLASPVCEYVREQDSSAAKGVCRVKRRGDAEEHLSEFTLDDAKRAALLGKAGTWQTATKRMLQLRARGFALRDKFADVLAGLVSAEEALDLPSVDSADPKINILEASQPLTLKDKLRAKVETEEKPEPAIHHAPEPEQSGAPVAGVDAEYLSKVLDAEDFLRGSQRGKTELTNIRKGYALQDGAYPLLPDHQAAYLADLKKIVERMQGK